MKFITVILYFLRIIAIIIASLLVFGLLLSEVLKLAMYFYLAKPEAKEIAYDLISYVEANDKFITNEMLKNYCKDYKDTDLQVNLNFIQKQNDRRFKINVSVQVYKWGMLSKNANIRTQSINLGEAPTNSIFVHCDSTDIESEIKNIKDSSEKSNDATFAGRNEKDESENIHSEFSDDEIIEVVVNYVNLGMEAIKYNDFSYVSVLLDPNGKIYNQSQDYIQTINNKGIKEELLDIKATVVNKVNQTRYTVKTYEEYKIIYPHGPSRVKGFNNEYLITTLNNQHFVINETLKSKEILNQKLIEHKETTDELLNHTCISCHGSFLEGSIGPPLYNLEKNTLKMNL